LGLVTTVRARTGADYGEGSGWAGDRPTFRLGARRRLVSRAIALVEAVAVDEACGIEPCDAQPRASAAAVDKAC